MLILIFLHGRRILFSIKKFNLSGFFLQSLSFKHLPFWDKFTTSDYLKGSGLLQIFLLQRWTWKSLTSKLGVYLWMLLPEFVPMWFPVCSLGPAAMEMEVSLDCAPESVTFWKIPPLNVLSFSGNYLGILLPILSFWKLEY